jgi:hypothetical protein
MLTVPVEISDKRNTLLLRKLCDYVLVVVDRGMRVLTRLTPTTVQINSDNVSSVIAVDHSINVKHWHNFEHKLLA